MRPMRILLTGATGDPERGLVAPALPEFLASHGGIELELGSSDRAIDLVHEGIDCALRVGGMPASSTLVPRPLGVFRLVNCASPAYLARHGMPRGPEDLPQHLAVNYAPPGGARMAPWEWVEHGRLRTQTMRAQVSANNAETYIACCLAGTGLIQIPAFDVREHLQAGGLVEVLADWPAPPMPVQIVYPHRRHLSRRVQAFSDWLAEVLAPCLEPLGEDGAALAAQPAAAVERVGARPHQDACRALTHSLNSAAGSAGENR